VLKRIMPGVLTLLSLSAAAEAQTWTGQASYYRAPHEMTCAHRSLPFGTRLRVTNLRNNRTAILTVADRGPFIRGRIVDVSVGAADVLGFRSAGVVPVKIETVVN
jgi:rare lipoprotein A